MNPPSVWFRLTPEVRQRATELAHRRGIICHPWPERHWGEIPPACGKGVVDF